jgi:peptide/nickel transport system substrate-binding protein
LLAGAMLAFAGGQAAQADGGSIAVALYANANTIDPNFSASHISRSMLFGVYEQLVTVDENTNVIPMLAESWTVSPDGLTYTFKLRQGVLFHNGKEMTSADVKASLERFAKVSPDRITMAPVATIEATGPYEVVIKLKEQAPSFLDRLASPATPTSIIPAEEAAKDLNKTGNIGTGPYQLVEWVPDSHLTLKRFDKYVPNTSFPGPTGLGGRKTAHFDTITFKIMTEASARVAALESGEVQLAEDIPVPAAKRLADNKAIKIYTLKSFNMPVLFVNNALPPTDNVKLRRAIQAALDMDQIMAAATDGLYELDHSWLWPGNPFYADTGKSLYNINNLEAAKKLLAESGYKGEPIIFNISNISFHAKIGTVVVEQLKALGLNVEARRIDWPTLVAAAGTDEGWNLATAGFSSQPFLGAYAYQPLFTGPTNWARVKSDPEMEAAWHTFNTSMDIAQRKAAWADIQRQTYEKAQTIKLGNQGFLIGASAKLKGYSPYIGAERLWDVTLE